jgi:hypothetical protein
LLTQFSDDYGSSLGCLLHGYRLPPLEPLRAQMLLEYRRLLTHPPVLLVQLLVQVLP